MRYFPMFVLLDGRRGLVVGGGGVAARKAALLARAGARVHVVAKELCAELAELAAAGSIGHRVGTYVSTDLEDIDVVIAATDDSVVNAAVSRDAQARRIPVNVVDQPELCSFIVPSIVDRSPLVVAISTAGAAPVLARRVRGQIEAMLPARLGDLAVLASRLRDEVKRRFPSISARRAFWERALESSEAAAALQGDLAAAESGLRALIERGEGNGTAALHVIAVGSGDPDLLPLRALHWMQVAALIAYGDGVAEEVLALARRDAHRERLDGDAVLAAVSGMARFAAKVRAGEHVCIVVPGDSPGGTADDAIRQAARAHGIPCRTLAPSSATEGHG